MSDRSEQIKTENSECGRNLDNRLATIEGHIRAVRKMLGESKCIDILTQLIAIESAIKKTGIVLLKGHMNTCIKDAVEKGDTQTVNELGKILEMYL